MDTFQSGPQLSASRTRVDFTALAATYDNLRFLGRCAKRLAERVTVPSGARVLDVATGTGTAAFVAAERAGRAGQVVGVDQSAEMLAIARRKLTPAGNPEVEFRKGDATRLNLADASFDVVLCASAIFFFPDMSAALREWRRVLSPGGSIGISSFGPDFLQPMREMWEECLRRHRLEVMPIPTHRLTDAVQCRQLFAEAGFEEIEVHADQLGYHLQAPEERWADIESGLEGVPLLALTPERQEAIRAEHLDELKSLGTAEGIWLDVPALFTLGRRALLKA